jgi:general secretion pathway protein G
VRGFTLIEIMVVVVILGILAAIVVPSIITTPDTARVTAVKADIKIIESALELYRLDNFSYPSTQQGLAALVSQPSGDPPAPHWKAEGYLKSVPKDPWGYSYQYQHPGAHGSVDVYTLGADGKPGGDGPNADIGNWADGF